MKTDLFVWGRPDEGAWSTVCPGSQPGCRRCRGVGRGEGGCPDRSIFVDEKEGHAQRE